MQVLLRANLSVAFGIIERTQRCGRFDGRANQRGDNTPPIAQWCIVCSLQSADSAMCLRKRDKRVCPLASSLTRYIIQSCNTNDAAYGFTSHFARKLAMNFTAHFTNKHDSSSSSSLTVLSARQARAACGQIGAKSGARASSTSLASEQRVPPAVL